MQAFLFPENGAHMTILQLKISVDGIQPPIWRRFLVKDDITFERLHKTIQAVMGWDDYHLYEFAVGDASIMLDEDGLSTAKSSLGVLLQSPAFCQMLEKGKKGSRRIDAGKIQAILKAQRDREKHDLKTKIRALICSERQTFRYTYDFGDNWDHTVMVEKVLASADAPFLPYCIRGKRACPPEDCGSIGGYYSLQEIKKDKCHTDYQRLIVQWLGEDFDFELFDLDQVNVKLRKLARMRRNDTENPRRKGR